MFFMLIYIYIYIYTYIYFFIRYLREIGYTDTIIDVRSSRVRQLLGVQAHNAENESDRIIMNGDRRVG